MKDILSWLFGTCYLLLLPAIISFGIVRFTAVHFASPKPWQWEEAYVSESPRSKSYHYSEDCKLLKKSTYGIISISPDEAEFDGGLEPCKSCIKESVKKQYDEFAMVLWLPVSIFLVWFYGKMKLIFKTYKFQSLLVKRSDNFKH